MRGRAPATPSACRAGAGASSTTTASSAAPATTTTTASRTRSANRAPRARTPQPGPCAAPRAAADRPTSTSTRAHRARLAGRVPLPWAAPHACCAQQAGATPIAIRRALARRAPSARTRQPTQRSASRARPGCETGTATRLHGAQRARRVCRASVRWAPPLRGQAVGASGATPAPARLWTTTPTRKRLAGSATRGQRVRCMNSAALVAPRALRARYAPLI